MLLAMIDPGFIAARLSSKY